MPLAGSPALRGWRRLPDPPRTLCPLAHSGDPTPATTTGLQPRAHNGTSTAVPLPDGQPFPLASKMAPRNGAFMALGATLPATAASVGDVTSRPLHKHAALWLEHSSRSSSPFWHPACLRDEDPAKPGQSPPSLPRARRAAGNHSRCLHGPKNGSRLTTATTTMAGEWCLAFGPALSSSPWRSTPHRMAMSPWRWIHLKSRKSQWRWIHLAQGWWGTTPPRPVCLQQHGAQSAAGPTGALRDPPNSQLPKSAATPQDDASPTSTSHTDSRQPHHKDHPAVKPQMSPASAPPTLAPHQRGPSPLLSPLGKSRRQGLPSSQRQRHSTRRSPLETAADHRGRPPQTIGDDRRRPSETTAGNRRCPRVSGGDRRTPLDTAARDHRTPLDTAARDHRTPLDTAAGDHRTLPDTAGLPWTTTQVIGAWRWHCVTRRMRKPVGGGCPQLALASAVSEYRGCWGFSSAFTYPSKSLACWAVDITSCVEPTQWRQSQASPEMICGPSQEEHSYIPACQHLINLKLILTIINLIFT